MSRHRGLEAVERRQREDDAARLLTLIPELEALRLSFCEKQGTRTVSEFARPIVLRNASSHIEIPCGDESCKAGGHDLTWEIQRDLKSLHTKFEGQSECHGQLGSTTCSRVLNYSGVAKYSRQES